MRRYWLVSWTECRGTMKWRSVERCRFLWTAWFSESPGIPSTNLTSFAFRKLWPLVVYSTRTTVSDWTRRQNCCAEGSTGNTFGGARSLLSRCTPHPHGTGWAQFWASCLDFHGSLASLSCQGCGRNYTFRVRVGGLILFCPLVVVFTCFCRCVNTHRLCHLSCRHVRGHAWDVREAVLYSLQVLFSRLLVDSRTAILDSHARSRDTSSPPAALFQLKCSFDSRVLPPASASRDENFTAVFRSRFRGGHEQVWGQFIEPPNIALFRGNYICYSAVK